MHLFVSEFVCGGFAGGLLESSLRREGLAMLRAVVEDFQRIPGCRVTTLWDERGGDCPIDGAEVVVTSGIEDAARLFRRLAAACDATFDIAPELDGALLQRRRVVAEAGGNYLGCSAEVIALCSDKLQFAVHLAAHEIPTIPTRSMGDRRDDRLTFPAVIKRRDGAGSLSIETVADRREYERARHLRVRDASLERWIVQPLIRGRHLSTAALICGEAGPIDVFPVGAQRLGGDGRFGYLGGRIPADAAVQQPVVRLVRETCASIPGLKGYVGFDVLLSDESPQQPVVVEINPRLTTSYLGYRDLAEENVAERLLFHDRSGGSIRWKQGTVEFDASGRVRFNDVAVAASGQ